MELTVTIKVVMPDKYSLEECRQALYDELIVDSLSRHNMRIVENFAVHPNRNQIAVCENSMMWKNIFANARFEVKND